MRLTERRCVLATILVLTIVACTGDKPPTVSSPGEPSPGQTAVVADSLGKITVSLPAGSAPAGSKLTATPTANPLPAQSAAVMHPLTTPINVELSGWQPTKPAVVSAVLSRLLPPGKAIWLVTQPASGGELEALPATYEPASRTVTASMPHFSLAFFAKLDIKPVLDEITRAFTATFGLHKDRPGCAGQPLTVGQIKYTLPERYRSKGDGIVWPCLRRSGQQVAVDLAAASGLPYLVRVSPKATLTYGGSVDIGKAAVLAGYRQFVKNPPYNQGLLVPGGSISYAFEGATLPGLVVAQLDVGTHLALSAVWAVQFLLTIFNIRIDLLEKAEVLSCVGDVVEAAAPTGKALVSRKGCSLT